MSEDPGVYGYPVMGDSQGCLGAQRLHVPIGQRHEPTETHRRFVRRELARAKRELLQAVEVVSRVIAQERTV